MSAATTHAAVERAETPLTGRPCELLRRCARHERGDLDAAHLLDGPELEGGDEATADEAVAQRLHDPPESVVEAVGGE